MESILTSIKKLLGIEEEYTHFDTDIIMHINSVFADLTQIGVGPSEGFSISDASSTWNEYTRDIPTIANVKQYIYLKVKLVFDPPTNSSVLTSYEKTIDRLEWRLNVAVDPNTDESEV